jgi:CRISPR/Cas system CMR-associated protein Cmr5 small subunit
MMKIEFKKIKMAYGLIQIIKGCHIHVCSFSNSPINKSYGSYAATPDMLLLDFQIKSS